MAVGNKFYQFVEDMAHKVHNLGADTIKVMLSSVAPVATNTVKANITEISDGNGYTAGGAALTRTSSAQTLGVYKLVLADYTFTASGGPIGPFRYIVFYNDTPTSPAKPLIAWYDIGSTLTLADGQSYLVDLSAVDGLLRNQ